MRSVEHQIQGVGRDNLSFFLHRYTVKLNNTLTLQLISDIKFWHIRKLTTSDRTLGRVNCLMHKNVHWTLNRSLISQQILRQGSTRTLHEEGPVSHSLGALKGSGYGKPFCTEKRDSLLRGVFFSNRCQTYKPGPVLFIHTQFSIRIRVNIIVRSRTLYKLVQRRRANRKKLRKENWNSPHLVSTHHRAQQGDTGRIPSRDCIRAPNAVDSGYKEKKSFSSLDWPLAVTF